VPCPAELSHPRASRGQLSPSKEPTRYRLTVLTRVKRVAMVPHRLHQNLERGVQWKFREPVAIIARCFPAISSPPLADEIDESLAGR
jgi:hypothetical protein